MIKRAGMNQIHSHFTLMHCLKDKLSDSSCVFVTDIFTKGYIHSFTFISSDSNILIFSVACSAKFFMARATFLP